MPVNYAIKIVIPVNHFKLYVNFLNRNFSVYTFLCMPVLIIWKYMHESKITLHFTREVLFNGSNDYQSSFFTYSKWQQHMPLLMLCVLLAFLTFGQKN